MTDGGSAPRRKWIGVLGALLALAGPVAQAQIQFQDVSSSAGITGQSETWGTTWGDYNGDGWPDAFVNGHRGLPRFYRNNADGTFTDVARDVDPGIWFSNPVNDQHGATFVDFDNDGDQDLYINVSATGPAQLLINDLGTFWEGALAADLNNDSAARAPIWFDWTQDGYLDVAVLHTGGIRLFRQDPASGLDFDSDNSTGINCSGRMNYGQLIDLNDDGSMELICIKEGTFPRAVYDTSSLPASNVTSWVQTAANVNDTAIADFDGDLRNDIFMVRGAIRPSHATLLSPNRIEAWLASSSSASKGFTFSSDGQLSITIDHSGLGAFQSPETLTLSPSGPTSGSAGNVNVSYSSGSGLWTVSISGNNRRAYVIIEADEPASTPTMFGVTTREGPMTARLMLNEVTGTRFDFGAGFQDPILCVSAVAGDFDNDMDQDLYLVCRRGVENLPNRLYENLGDGNFVLVPNAGGAEGLVGAGLQSGVGVGDAVTTVDYDSDGFLDLFINNGLLMRPWGDGGRDNLLRNVGNSNHWMQLDLEGTSSNRDGVGARVYVTAGGVTQLREQNGGHHRWAQNAQRMHVGLAGNTTFDMTIHWPSGAVDTHTGVTADKIYRAVENGNLEEVVLGPPISDGLQPGDECGDPNVNGAFVYGVSVWKNCSTGRWSLRVSCAGCVSKVTFDGRVVSDANVQNVSGFSIEGGDVIDTSTPTILDFSLGVRNAGVDGIDFDLGSGAQGCLQMDLPVDVPLLVGASGKSATLPFELTTLSDCANAVSVEDTSVDEGAGTATVTISLSGPSTQNVSVDYATADGTATAGSDYTGSSGTATITAGNTSTTFLVPINDDALTEGNETFDVNLSNPVNALIGTATATVTIIDNEANPCGQPSYSASTEMGMFVWKDCGATGSDQVWHMRITGGGSADVIQYSGDVTSTAVITTTGFSLEGNDVVDSSPGDGFVDYVLKVKNAGQDGFEMTTDASAQVCFGATLPAGANIYVGAGRHQVQAPFDLATLQSCSQEPAFVVNDVSVIEGPGGVNAVFTVSLTQPNTETRSVDYATADDSATAGADYTAVSGTLTFPSGTDSLQVNVPILDDGAVEGDETFSLNLTNPVNADINDNQGTATIVDNDVIPVINIADVTVAESDGSAQLTVSLSAASGNTVTVGYATADGTASAGSDFDAASGTLTFTPGQTSQSVTINLIDDSTPEPTETFQVNLNSPTNATIGDGSATVTVTDSDGPVTVFADGFEGASTWVSNPDGTDTGTTGQWEAADPEGTSSSGAQMQLENAFAGTQALVTDGDAGSSVGSFDIDNGVVSVASPDIALPSGGTLTLSLQYYLGHLSNSSSSDFFRVTIEGSSQSQVVLDVLGASSVRSAAWTSFSTDISAFAGDTVRILVEAADAGSGSLVEAGVDEVSIVQN